MLFPFQIWETKAVIPLPSIILRICTEAGDFVTCKHEEVQTRKHEPGQHFYLWKLAITGGNTDSTGALVYGYQGLHKHLGREMNPLEKGLLSRPDFTGIHGLCAFLHNNHYRKLLECPKHLKV